MSLSNRICRLVSCSRPWRGWPWSLLALLLLATPAMAMSLIPMTQNFTPSGEDANQSFRLQNDSNESVAVVVSMTTRAIDVNGNESEEETKDFAVYPTQILIAPKRSQVVRVQWRGDPALRTEQAYRIIAEQQPVKRAPAGPGKAEIQLLVRYVGSVYVVPQGARPDVVVRNVRGITAPDGHHELELLLHNQGSAHALLDAPSITLRTANATQTLTGPALETMRGENILAGADRLFSIPWPNGLPFSDRPEAKFVYTPPR